MAKPVPDERPAPLLPGEDPAVADPVEIQHWIAMYEERLEIWRRRLRRARDPVSRTELQRQLEEFQARTAFWRNRHAQLAGLRLDPVTREMAGRQGAVRLTRREYELMSYLADHPGRHTPPALLVGRAWQDAELCEEQLRTYVTRLRRKLRAAGAPCRIIAERARGYVLVFDEDVVASTAP